MGVAIREARKALGRTSPNPAVGAVLVAGSKIISRGHHEEPGGPHAEIRCLGALRQPLPSHAILYVTLEPCSTVGKTGPCTEAIIRSGIATVVVGALDPNPRHNGRGIAALQRAGIAVRVGIVEAECRELNEGFNQWIVSGRPFVVAKCGMSLDGRLTLPPDGGRWITNPAARRDARQLRTQVDAILVGAETIRADNPRLTVRGVKNARQPWRVILTKSGRLPLKSRVLRDQFKNKTLIYRNKSLKSVLLDLGKKKILSVMIEGGGQILGQALDAGLIDKVQIYIGPVLAGGPVIALAGRGAVSTRTALRLERLSYTRIGHDLRVIGYRVKETSSGSE